MATEDHVTPTYRVTLQQITTTQEIHLIEASDEEEAKEKAVWGDESTDVRDEYSNPEVELVNA